MRPLRVRYYDYNRLARVRSMSLIPPNPFRIVGLRGPNNTLLDCGFSAGAVAVIVGNLLLSVAALLIAIL